MVWSHLRCRRENVNMERMNFFRHSFLGATFTERLHQMSPGHVNFASGKAPSPPSELLTIERDRSFSFLSSVDITVGLSSSAITSQLRRIYCRTHCINLPMFRPDVDL